MKLAPLAAALFVLASLSAQEEQEPKDWNPFEKGLTPQGDLYPVEWRIHDRGQLLIKPSPGMALMQFGPMFHNESLGLRLRYLSNLGAVGLFRVLFIGERDFLSLADGDYLFRKLELPRTDAEIRQWIAKEAKGDSAQHHRLLAVRVAEARKLKSAQGELLELAADTEADPLLRWAAEDALVAISGRDVKQAAHSARFPSVDDTLAAVPRAYHLICTIQQRHVPQFSRLGDMARRLTSELMIIQMKGAGGVVSPFQLAGAQFFADLGTILPYEICRKLGNFRIGRTTVTLLLHGEPQRPLFWARCDGWFDPGTIHRALQHEKFDSKHDEKTNTVTAKFAKLGLHVVVARNHAELRSISYPVEERAVDKDQLAMACVSGPHVLGLWVKDGKPLHSLLSRSGVDLPAFENAVMTFDLHRGGKLEARTTLPDEKQAAALARWLQDKIEFLNSRASPQQRRAFNVFKKGLDIGSKGDAMHVKWSPEGITLEAICEALHDR